MSQTLVFYGQFTSSGLGATGLTVTVDITRVTRSDGTQASAANGASATEITTPNARGGYLYRLTGADLSLYDYYATFITSGTADLKHVPGLWTRYTTGDLPPLPRRGDQFVFPFFMLDSSDHTSGKTGLTVTAKISKDGGAFATCSNAVSEISLGWYKVTLTTTEMDAAEIALMFTGTAADAQLATITTAPN